MMLNILLVGLLMMYGAHANQLLHEDSPYLQQHAHNPVAWYPWGDAAFKKAKKEDKLIFLSIGYSTCHWCHVMEHESFENPSVAKVLNRDFVSIKVDREEYPNIDRHYQDIYALMHQSGGGWPLTIVMTPDKRVFFSATYLPADDTYGHAGLKDTLHVLVDAYRHKRDVVLKSAASIEAAAAKMREGKQYTKVSLDRSIAQKFVQQIASEYDTTNKGIATAPKFPLASTMDMLLDIYRINGDKKALDMADESLMAMSKGGIYDQIEGGFYRYSTDERWMIPHFEKMLYTNAELLSAFANAYALTQKPRFKKVTAEVIENINERFLKNGMFYSASDADSDGQEGKYFVFDYHDSLKDLEKGGFSTEGAKEILHYFSIYSDGNFENEQTNPYLSGMQAPKDLSKGKAILRHNRAKKNYPFIDKKIQTSWNALYCIGLLKAARYVDPTYSKQALQTLDALLENLYHDGTLYHQLLIGKKLKVKGYLEDYAFLISALIAGYEVNFSPHYLKMAHQLMEEAIKKFYQNDTWYMSDDDFRTKAQFYDGSYRSAKAVMIENILKLALLYEDIKLDAFAQKSLSHELADLKAAPSQYPYGLKVYLESLTSFVVIKSTKKNLLQNKKMLLDLKYPFVLLKPGKDENFLACKIDRCFAVDKKLKNVLDTIDGL